MRFSSLFVWSLGPHIHLSSAHDEVYLKAKWKGEVVTVDSRKFSRFHLSKHGTYQFANGDIYEGFWKDANYNGYGAMTFISGDKYEGDWKDGNFHGIG